MLRAHATYLPSRYAGAASLLLALAVLVGWAASIDVLKSVLPGCIAMNPVTAINFAALGAGLVVLGKHPAARRASRVLGMFVCVIAALRVSDYLWQTGLQVDRLLFASQLGAVPNQPPNRMAPNTAIAQMLLGAALASYGARIAKLKIPEALAIPTLVIALFAMVGYAYGLRTLYSLGPFVPMAVHTAVALFALSVAIVLADAEHGIAKLWRRPSLAGIMTRRLLPVAVMLPALIGWLRLRGELAGMYPSGVGVALFAVSTSIIFATLVLRTGASLQRTDEQRVLAQEQLEQVVERLARTNSELERLATVDGLTGVLNRRAWLERFEAEIARAKRYGSPLSALMIDADHFKQVNDRYGHLVGDDVLRALAKLFTQTLRQTDLLGRYGGEEFCIFLPNTGLEGARVVAERLCDQVRALVFTTDAGARVNLSCSIGIADFAHGRATSSDVLGAADVALYAAKSQRGCVRAALSPA